MGKPASLLEKLCEHVRSFGAESIEVENKEGHEVVVARKDDTLFSIASFKSSSADAKELRQNLYAAQKKPVRTVLCGELSILKVDIHDNFGEDAFEVSIAPAPRPDPSI